MHAASPWPRTSCYSLTALLGCALGAVGCTDDPWTPPSAPADLQPPSAPVPTGGPVPVVAGLSLAEREAVADMVSQRGPRGPVLLALVDGEGNISEMTVAAGEVEAVADRLAGEGITAAVSALAYPADDVATAPDPELLFAGKEVFGLAGWSAAHPYADGRGVRIAVVDDGVALRRPGLLETSIGTPKIAKVINTAASWLLPLYPAGHACRKEAA